MAQRVGITGAAGQLGFVTRARLQHHHGMQVLPADRRLFGDDPALQDLVATCDVVVHLAGINRGTDEQVEQGNVRMTEALVEACRAARAHPAIIFASSVHRNADTPYGRAKRRCSALLEEFCQAGNAPFCEMVLPNLFGEFSRPFYNNFVATFCHQISRDENPSIHEDAHIELLHYVDAADHIAQAVASGASGQRRPAGMVTSVATVARQIADFHRQYAGGIIPDLRDPFALRLFNTYRSHVYPRLYPGALVRHADGRGAFFECVRAHNDGQVSFSTTLPGIARGGHFHFFKFERFLVVAGSARIAIRRLYSDDTVLFDVTGAKPCFVDMPTMHTHKITNTSNDELLTLFWTNEFYDPDNPDTHAEPV